MKPVAWMSPDGKVSQTEGKLFHIPLYAASKPLSDDEIEEVYYKDFNFESADMIEFAKVILKKAKENENS